MCSLTGAEISVVVADDGTGFDPARFEGWRLPDRFASGGRGLFLMRELMDDIDIDSTPDGTTVTLSRRVVTRLN
jgi:anti-sigma regulatory factor (Ser/Thr protein kinase)